MHIAIIGAGLAGLSCAGLLKQQGYRVTVYEKSRGCGGRMATRQTELGGFDHGAQYFTATSADFRRTLATWQQSGWVEAWDARLASVTLDGTELQVEAAGNSHQRYVAVPGMRALGERLAEGLDLRFEQRVTSLESRGAQWNVVLEQTGTVSLREGPYDAVVVAIPPDQAVPVLAASTDSSGRTLETLLTQAMVVKMAPCWAVMLAFQEPVAVDYDAAWVNGARLSWICRDSSKPGRRAGEHWVGHASAAWSAVHVEDDPERAQEKLIKAFHDITGSSQQPIYARTHRWLYSQAASPLAAACCWDAVHSIGLCGDWFSAGLDGGGRVETAVLSGQALAAQIGSQLEQQIEQKIEPKHA